VRHLLDFELDLIVFKNSRGGGKEIPSLDKLFRGALVFDVTDVFAAPTYRMQQFVAPINLFNSY